MRFPDVRLPGIGKVGNVAMLLALIGAIATGALVFGGGGSKETMLQSLFLGWTFFLFLSLGALGLTLLHHTVRGSWGHAVIRLFEAMSSPATFGMLGITYFVGMMAGWHEYFHGFHLSESTDWLKRLLMSQSVTIGSSVVFFCFWIVLSYVLRASSVRQDASLDEKEADFRTNLSAPMIVVFFLSVTFGLTLWIMALDAHWFSTIFPAWLLIGGALTSLAFVNTFVMKNAEREPYAGVMNKFLSKDLGNMMLVFTLLWAYTSLSQLLIIWCGNVPEFSTFYVSRMTPTTWGVVGVILIICQFFVPFVTLLAPRAKAFPKLLGSLALFILFVRVLDVSWVMLPFFRPEGMKYEALDLLGFVFVGAMWAVCFAKYFEAAQILPNHSARLKEAYEHA